MTRELIEIIAYAIGAYKKGDAVEQIFNRSPTDANGYMAKFIVECIEFHAVHPATSDVDAERYHFLRAGNGRDHEHHTQQCLDVVVCDWGKNLGAARISGGGWTHKSITGAEMDKVVDSQMAKAKGK